MSNESKSEKHLKEVGIDFNRDLNPDLYDRMFGDYEPVTPRDYPDFVSPSVPLDSDFPFQSVTPDALATDIRSLTRESDRLRDLGPLPKPFPVLKQIDPDENYVQPWYTLTPRQQQDKLVDMIELGLDMATLGEGTAANLGGKLVGKAAKRMRAGMPRLADYVLHPKMLRTRGVRGGKIGTEGTAIPPPLRDGEWIKGTVPHKVPDIDATRWPLKKIKYGGVRKVAPVPPKKPSGDFDWRIYTGWDDVPDIFKNGKSLRNISPASTELLGR